jgi:hypothetical protein
MRKKKEREEIEDMEDFEAGGLLIGEPVDLDKLFRRLTKHSPEEPLPVEYVIALYGLRGLEGNRTLLHVYQDYLKKYDSHTVPHDHLRAWEILVDGRVRSDKAVAATVLRWGMQRCELVKRAECKLLHQVLGS